MRLRIGKGQVRHRVKWDIERKKAANQYEALQDRANDHDSAEGLSMPSWLLFSYPKREVFNESRRPMK